MNLAGGIEEWERLTRKLYTAGISCVVYVAAQIPTEQVVAFGDGNNDVEFLSVAGLGICMQNGSALAKQSAKRVSTFTNNEDGVSRELSVLFGLP